MKDLNVYLFLVWAVCSFYTSESTHDCSALLYGAKEIANGISYQGGIMWGGCSGDFVVGDTTVEVSLFNSDNDKLLSKNIDVVNDQYDAFDLDVPADACVVGKELTLQLRVTSLDIDWTPIRTQLKCMDNSNVLLVQMNKPLYKPGDTMKAQIFCLERENTGKCENVEITVHIANPQGTMMNVQEYAFGTGVDEKLVAEYSYRVDQKPVLGQYCLIIQPKSKEISAKTVEKCFDIEEYVLPTFESEISFDQGAIIITNVVSITGELKATYTYGQPVATALFHLKCWMDESNIIYEKTISESDLKTFTIEKAVIERALAKYREDYWSQNPDSLKCVVNATEFDVPGLPYQSSESTISVEEKEIIVECCDTFSCPEIVRPGKYSTCLTVRYADGSNYGAALDSNLALNVMFKQCGREDQSFVRQAEQVIIGKRNEFTFDAQEKSTEKDSYDNFLCYSWSPVYQIEAFVQDGSNRENLMSLKYSPDLSEYHSEVMSYLSVDVCDSESVFEANKDVCVSVNLVQKPENEDINSIIVIIKSRGVVRSVTAHNVSSFPLQIVSPITPEMTPNFVVFVSAMGVAPGQKGKEVLPASVTIPVEQNTNVLPNQVTLAPSEPVNGKFYSPGDTVNMRVTTSASDSIVALIGLDKRMVAAAGKANIIQLDDVVEALASSSDSKDDDDFHGPIFFCWFPLPSSSTDAHSTIEDAGLVYLVSGSFNVPIKVDDFYYGGGVGGGIYFDDVMFGVAEAESGGVYRNELAENSNVESTSQTTSSNPAAVRKSFPEVTLFRVLSSSGSGSNSFYVDIDLGDTLTTHIVHASAISPTVGFGTIFEPKELLVFKEVSSNLQTPYSMKRYESFNASITVCNYKKDDLDVKLEIFFNPNEFFDITKDITGGASCTDDLAILASQECQVFQCPFKALQMGNPRMGLELSGKSKDESDMQIYDRLVKKIKVKPEGCENERSLRTVELHAGEHHVFHINVSDPLAVDKSGIAHVSMYSSLTAPALQNPEQLVRMPMGCGEQTMTLLAPLIYLKKILLAAGMSLSVEKEQLLTQYMDSGYNRELTYKHQDGSFSAFGEGDKSGSTWLTAFVAKTFSEAKKDGSIDVASDVLLKAYQFMLNDRVFEEDGRVIEVGRVIHTEMQGGSTGRNTMTAYHLLSLSQMPREMFDSDMTSSQKERFNSLMDLVKTIIGEGADAAIANNYLLCLGGNAVFDAITMMGADPFTDEVLEKVRDRVSSAASGGCGRSYWTNEEPTSDSECECAPEEQMYMYYYSSDTKKVANKVEVTGYCLAFLSKMDSEDDALLRQKAMSWLGCQQSDYGGFSTTQNTVTGFYGLATNAAASEATDLFVTVTDSFGNVTNIPMDDSLEVFKYEYTNVPDVNDSSITVTVEAAAGGQGKIYASGILYYNTKSCSSAGKDDNIKIEAFVKDPQEQSIQVDIIMRYFGAGAGSMGMGIIECECLSGFGFTEESAAEVEKLEGVKRAEIDSGSCKMNIYTDDVPEELKLSVTLKRVDSIAGQQGATVRGGSYYNPLVQSSVLYNSEALSSGDIFQICNDCVTNGGRKIGSLTSERVSLLLLLTILMWIMGA